MLEQELKVVMLLPLFVENIQIQQSVYLLNLKLLKRKA